MLFQIVTAYVVSLTIYQLGSLCSRHPAAFAIIVTAITLAIGLFFALKYIIKTRRHRAGVACSGCANCSLKYNCKK